MPIKATRVVVQAEGSVQVEPDRSTLVFRVRARENDRNRAVERARGRLETLSAVLDRFHVDARRRRVQSITTTELMDPKTRKRIGYEADAVVSVRLANFALLGDLYHAAATAGEIDITGPQWEVSANNEGHLEACRRAAMSARRRAEAYASGAGLSLGRLVRLQERPFGGAPQFTYAAPLAAARPGATAAGDGAGIEMVPGTVRLSASVEAVYELLDASPPEIGET